MNHTQLKSAVLELLRLRSHYTTSRVSSENAFDFPLYAYLEGRFGSMSRQYPIRIAGRQRVSRIDFRKGTHNPLLLEFAVRPPTGGSQLYGTANTAELRKLCRIPYSRTRGLILLLIDLYRSPVTKPRLKATYDDIHSGRGGAFSRRAVSIIYVHQDLQYTFRWKR